MSTSILSSTSYFLPEDDDLSGIQRQRVQIYRLLSLIGALLVTGLTEAQSLSYVVEMESPRWAHLGISGLYLTLFAGSYVNRWIRHHYVILMWTLCYLQMAWIISVAVMLRWGTEGTVSLLLTYGGIAVTIELGADTLRPLGYFLLSGYIATVTAIVATSSPQTDPVLLLGGCGIVALSVALSLQGRVVVKEKNNLLNGLIETSPNVVLQINYKGEIVKANGTVRKVFGTEKSDIVGSHYSSFEWKSSSKDTTGWMGDTKDDVFKRVLEGRKKRVKEEECILSGKDDRSRILSISGTTIENQTGKKAAVFHLQDITEREESRQQLKRYREYTGRLLNATNDLFFAINETGQLQRWNDRLLEVTGYDDEAVQGETVFKFLPREHEKVASAKIMDTIRKGQGRIEIPLQIKNGDTIPYEFLGNHVQDPEGGSQIVVIGRDVSKRRKRKRRLERKNDLFKKAQEIADVGAWEYDVETGHIWWSKQAHRIHQVEENESKTGETENAQKYIETFYNGESRARLKKAFNRAINRKESYQLELEVKTRKGEKRWVRVGGEPQPKNSFSLPTHDGENGSARENGNEEGHEEVSRIRGTIQDITEQKEKEETLREQKEKIIALYEATGQLLHAQSEREISERIHHLLGEVLGYKFHQTEFVRDGEVVHQHTETPVKDPDSTPQPHRRDGSIIMAEVLLQKEPIVIEDASVLRSSEDYGTLNALAGIPIGERGAMLVGRREEGLDEVNLHVLRLLGGFCELILERLDREKQLREAKQEAEKAKEEAQEASQMKSSMLANMSHEIRTPLTSIIGFAELLGEGKKQTDVFASKIDKSAKRLLETLDSVLNLSKLEAGQMELDVKPINLSKQASEVAGEMNQKAKEKGLSLTTEIEEEIWGQADEGAVQIVLRNLVSNAIKYTEEGGNVRIGIKQAHDKVCMEVEDNGIGMEEEMADRLFEPFRQASEGLSRKYEGTGVGLAVTQEAVQQMDGNIDVESEPGSGSLFQVWLPALDTSSPDASSPNASSQEASSTNASSRGDSSRRGQKPKTTERRSGERA